MRTVDDLIPCQHRLPYPRGDDASLTVPWSDEPTIVDRATDRCIGEVVLNGWRPADQTVNLRILVGEEGRGRRLGTEATALMVEHAFTVSDTHRVELEVYSHNPRALYVYERVCFVVEGRRREALLFDGESIDSLVMAVLRPDWLAARARRRT